MAPRCATALPTMCEDPASVWCLRCEGMVTIEASMLASRALHVFLFPPRPVRHELLGACTKSPSVCHGFAHDV